MPVKQPRRGQLWLNDELCVRLRPERRNHVWVCDFVQIGTKDDRAVRLLTVIDEYTKACLAIRAGRDIRSPDVLETFAGLMTDRGVPDTSARITDWSSLPGQSANGLVEWASELHISSQGRRGKTDMWRVSTAS